jgi:hypothetical protein
MIVHTELLVFSFDGKSDEEGVRRELRGLGLIEEDAIGQLKNDLFYCFLFF